jgi:hypothetical protein
MDNANDPERYRDVRALGCAVRQGQAIKRCLMQVAVVVLAGPAVSFAQVQEPPLGALSSRDQWIATFEQLPEAKLRTIFLRCDRESREHLLQFDEAVMCAMAWDALLKRGFTHDVEAMLAWWRENRDATPARSAQLRDAERR